MSQAYYEQRLSKLESWVASGRPRFPERFKKTSSCGEAREAPDGTDLSCAGRLMTLRQMGKLSFAHLQDHTGRLQIAFNVRSLGSEEYAFLLKHLDLGDYVGLTGSMFTTKTGERTLDVGHCVLLSKSLRPLPEKWHGLTDIEVRARQRYLDLIANEETRRRFDMRSRAFSFIRRFLEASGFLEVETPILQAISSGASARPFVTHHNALDMPLYLRIAPETYLKRLIAGGYERVYEIGKCFRNEGIDASHLQEFTMLEFYAAYWNFRDNMRFIQTMLQELVKEVKGSLQFEFRGQTLDFGGDWPEITYRDLVLGDTGIDLEAIATLEELKSAIREKGLEIPVDEHVGVGSLMDSLYKKYSRQRLVGPVFITMHPTELVPLARRSDADPRRLDMFQVVVQSWELVKAYSELVDPLEQRSRLLAQKELAEAGDEEAMMMEDDFVLAMEYGMPPMSGLGLGLDRLVALLADSRNVRDVIYFPNVAPISRQEIKGARSGAPETNEGEEREVPAPDAEGIR
jgi:lysyl-tRNA synthetase, class II